MSEHIPGGLWHYLARFQAETAGWATPQHLRQQRRSRMRAQYARKRKGWK